MQLYIYIQHKARHILENSSIWWDFANCLDCISNSKYEYEHLSPSVFCISNLNCFRCLPEHGMEQACLEACVVYRGKQKGWVPPVTHLWCLGLGICTAKAPAGFAVMEIFKPTPTIYNTIHVQRLL